MPTSGRRIPSGIQGLDEILHGGLLANRSYLVVGGAGTGKTLLSFQWLLAGVEAGERCIYLTLAEAGDEIIRNTSLLGWDVSGVTMVDLSPAGDSDELSEPEYHLFPPSEVERVPLWQKIYELLNTYQPDRLVIDSVTQLRYLSTDDYQFRKHILGLVNFLNRIGCTSLLAFEPSEMARDMAVGLAVDGILRLRHEISEARFVGLRNIQVEKFRGSDFMSGLHSFRITNSGVTIYPHRVEKIGDSQPGKQLLKTGIEELDELFGGGLESGTTTILSGPTGVGKSTLGIQFLVNSLENGERGIIYTFEESINSLLTRTRTIGLNPEPLLESGALKIVRINPLELYPDEFLSRIREEVENNNRHVLVFDSLRGYELAMTEFGSPVANIHNMVTYLNRNLVTTLLINEVEELTQLISATGMGVSHLADNIILLRYAELEGKVIKIVACLKKRIGNFEPQLRQFIITDEGIKVGKKMEHMQGVLTGTPTYRPPPHKGEHASNSRH